jgi:predicted nucleic acid-binding protein
MKSKDTPTKQKANITLKLDRDLLREIRILAAGEDTSDLLVYAHDHSARAKRGAALDLVRNISDSGAPVISTQVLQELVVRLRRKVARLLDAKKIRKIVIELQEWEVFVNNGDSMLRALEIEEQYQVSFWDGLTINAAHSSGAEILYAEDLNHGQVFGGVRVVNPFRSGPSLATDASAADAITRHLIFKQFYCSSPKSLMSAGPSLSGVASRP